MFVNQYNLYFTMHFNSLSLITLYIILFLNAHSYVKYWFNGNKFEKKQTLN